ncbi:hypothetical protein GHT09_011952 [Marmota monax]|uniref:Guanylate-binding protein/Atlastin C-terminal domain-containing protein n=1 Tax=Marmota monax TaxID=9995 RepID=A0A834QEP4_MARMO|nr:hypothetical protein GHT09_011952 [Marmota monax]
MYQDWVQLCLKGPRKHSRSKVNFGVQTGSRIHQLSGLENLVLTYINTVNSGDLPFMENKVLALPRQRMQLQ